MITRMEITYRSKEPCSKKPEIFTTGGYEVSINNTSLNFDFLDMEAACRFEDGFLFIDVLQKNLDEDVLGEVSPELADMMLRKACKEHFVDIFYECYADVDGTLPIELIPVDMEFSDFSSEGDGLPIKVLGDTFCNLISA